MPPRTSQTIEASQALGDGEFSFGNTIKYLVENPDRELVTTATPHVRKRFNLATRSFQTCAAPNSNGWAGWAFETGNGFYGIQHVHRLPPPSIEDRMAAIEKLLMERKSA